jgi:mannose-6-phosphate isomerase-like protein (cupin superfamily)
LIGTIVERAEWAAASATNGEWRGELEGGPCGANISVIFVHAERPGDGPRLHSHPYTETFIIRKGRALFTVADHQFEVSEGQIVICPGNTPHKFANIGPGSLEQIDIHEAGTFETRWLE